MDSGRIYTELVENARNRVTPDAYVERHHIIPKCIGGYDFPCNIVELTFREHYIAHWLLSNIHKEDKKSGLHLAFLLMAGRNRDGCKVTSKAYAIAKRRNKLAAVGRGKGLKRSKEFCDRLSVIMKGRKHNSVTRKKMSESARNKAPPSQATRDKLSIANKGRKYPPSFGRKISERKIGVPLSKEHVAALVKSWEGGRVVTEEAKWNMSLAGRKNSPIYKLPAIITTATEPPFKVDCLYTWWKTTNIKKGTPHRLYKDRGKGRAKTVNGYGIFPVDMEDVQHPTNPRKKLTDTKVRNIKILLRENISTEEIMQMYGVGKCCIHDIKQNKTWKHVQI